MASPAPVDPVPPTPARRIGRYDIVGRLGGGGMATVYAGRLRGPAGFERLVAIKVCHEHLNDDPAFVNMFLDEARIAAAIRHPNVVPTIEVETEPRLFMVLELVDGWPLHRVIESAKEPIPIPVVLGILRDALRGLHAAHELRDSEGRPLLVVHRDVSPANILVGADGITRITDFGVARAEQRAATTKDGSLKGKFGYMAPEQLRHDTLDRRLDVFAAGVVLWETLTGRRLFRGDTEQDTVARILSGPIPKPSSQRPDIPEQLDAIVLKALARDVDRRYPSADALCRAIEASALEVASTEAIARYVAQLPPSLPQPIRDSIVAVPDSPEHSRVARRRGSSMGRAAIGLVAAAIFGAAIAVGITQLGGDDPAPATPEPTPAPVAEAPIEPTPADPAPTAEPAPVEAIQETEPASPTARRRRRARSPIGVPPAEPTPEPSPPPPVEPRGEFTPSSI